MTVPVLNEPDERIVEEVHCSECGVPIPAIPGWYAAVNVRFTCDTCRQKSPKLAAPVPAAVVDTPRAALVDGDGENEPALDDIDVEDLGLEDADADADAEAEVEPDAETGDEI
jgi:hypothetical protein